MILNINGRDCEIQGGTRLLLETLRDELGLGGTKEGCGVGMCGACTILVDGLPMSACLMLTAQAAGHALVTIEGLAGDGALHPVQQAFMEEGAFQCGYCTPGFVLSAAALLEENPAPDEAAIREYLSGNLCRCGSYQNILKAVKGLAGGRIKP
jgi:aerobic-type carbon monoxide dehydrogenase small subunit (CoxS/CutS family)